MSHSLTLFIFVIVYNNMQLLLHYVACIYVYIFFHHVFYLFPKVQIYVFTNCLFHMYVQHSTLSYFKVKRYINIYDYYYKCEYFLIVI